MAIFTLSKSARELLVGCISVGVEGVETEGLQGAKDLDAIAALLEELTESEAIETEITVMPVRPTFEQLAGEHEDYSETIGIPGVAYS